VKRRLLGIGGALALALIGTIVLISYVQGAEDRALEGQKVVKVLVAAEPIDQNTSADDLEGKVEFKKVSQNVKAEGAVTSIKQLGDRVTSAELVPGEQIVKARFVEPSEAGRDAPGSQRGDKLLQTTIALEPERAMGGIIKPGDTVAFTASFDPDDAPSMTHTVRHKLKVTNVQIEADAAAAGGPQEGGEAEGEEAAEAPGGRFLVTLASDAPTVEIIVFTVEFGNAYLSAEPQDADESGTGVVVLDPTAVATRNVFT
jgi:pilus assembly protein CpaB